MTEYVTIDRQVLEKILWELGEIKKLATTAATVVEEAASCSDEFVSEQK